MSTDLSDPSALGPELADIVKVRFPLIPRAKPVCRSLEERVARVRHLAHLAQQHQDESLTRAAEAHNLAALIASDCAMPALARVLCWRQFDAFNSAGPLDAATAKLTLQPLVNLGRLLIRDGDGTAAYQLLETLFKAVKSRAEAVVDGRIVDFRDLVDGVQDHQDVVRWLWSILLADGTRALTRAGRWNEAHQHTLQHKGVGMRLFDGRQVAIIAHCASRAHADADEALAATVAATPWEQAIAACLKVVCLRSSGQETASASTVMMDRYLALEPGQDHTMFHVRLGLCVIDLVDRQRGLERIAPVIEHIALEGADAYAAQQVLSHQRPLPLTAAGSHALAEIVSASGLGKQAMPDGLQNDLLATTRASEMSLADALATMSRTCHT